MKFMKLGSKPDSFQSKGKNIRFVQSELATDIIINAGGVIFHLHKLTLSSKSSCIQKLVSSAKEDNLEELQIPDIPGGPAAFETCAKFCYGMTVTLNAYNVISVRCAAEYLGMHEAVEKGNLIYKIEVFLSTSIFHAWKDSIIALRSMKHLLAWCEDLKLVSNCADSIASKASVNVSKVNWSYTYNRKQKATENSLDPLWDGVRREQSVPVDWWVEDLCELDIDFYKRIIVAIKAKGRVSAKVIGKSLRAYTCRCLPNFDAAAYINSAADAARNRSLLQTVVRLLPTERDSVSCRFLLKLLRAVILMHCGEASEKELIRQIGRCLECASVTDLLIPSMTRQNTMYDIDMVISIVKEFMLQNCSAGETAHAASVSDSSKIAVFKLVDGCLAEIAKDPDLHCSKFTDIAELIPRPVHDGLYHAIDVYLKEHPSLSKSEKKRLCSLLDCKKLSAETCGHAVQNERLPLRVVVQILFVEQMRAASDSGGSYGSSMSAVTTNPEEEWEGLPGCGGGNGRSERNSSSNDGANPKMPRRMLGELLSSKNQNAGENSRTSNTWTSD